MNKKFFIIPLLIIIFDQITKLYIRTEFAIGDSIKLIGNIVKITYIENQGAAFGMKLGNQSINRILLASISFVAIFFIIYLIKNSETKIQLIAFHLILGGAFGNFIDRAFRGTVTDFVDCDFPNFLAQIYGSTRWPIFNVADSAIFIAFILLIFEIVFEKK
ncbi:MAG: signal peptidase II, partial [Candidatus Cloacimonadota bacterium]|nr:signal peptidase II [Candidatus Cloacimonadota bacterium]